MSPIIILGMHRSGTTMLANMLEKCGLFIGPKENVNREPVVFRNVNDWLLSLCGGAWDWPEPFGSLLANDRLRSQSVTRARAYALSFRSQIRFLGMYQFIRSRLLESMNIPWGWKDPRNTFTLPIWLDIFPDAKVIHICRHGVDVAESLRRREQRLLSARNLGWTVRKTDRLAHQLTRGGYASPRCLHLEGGFSLWEAYMREAIVHCTSSAVNSLTVRYEDILRDPKIIMARITEFCEIDCSDSTIDAIASRTNPERAYAFRNSAELLNFAASVQPRLAAYDY